MFGQQDFQSAAAYRREFQFVFRAIAFSTGQRCADALRVIMGVKADGGHFGQPCGLVNFLIDIL